MTHDPLIEKQKAVIRNAEAAIAALQATPGTDDGYPMGTVIIWQRENDDFPNVSVRKGSRWIHAGMGAATYERWEQFRAAYLIAKLVRYDVILPGDKQRTEGPLRDLQVILTGTPAHGFKVIGPFDSDDEAIDYADMHITAEYCWVQDMTVPAMERGDR